ncbi:MAG: DNA mismatch repair endonuclease MutL [bacterium]|nr:DNA mismatch repair endonuclease MutL [bacterium]
MSIIKILPENLVNQIAAGEVVERPASVVKELIENSIDAGANSIVIEVKDGGKSFIKVTDNGKGMSREDLEMALQRHATSKISDEKDLWSISTMGFRGEALASIASVSKLSIKSKTENDLGGSQIDCEGGDIRSISDIGMSTGTTVEVFDLFFNTPARQKYLKKDASEFGHIAALFNTIALGHPEIAMKLIHNGKVVSDYARVTDLISRVSDVFGNTTADAMLPIFYGGSDFHMDGFIGKPLLSRSTTSHQYIFVNGRAIQHHLLAHRIKAAYHSMLMENKKPVFILNIKIDPSLIDVNVHPRKIEIRFEDQQTLIKTVYGSVSSALEKANLMPKGFSESRNYMSDRLPKMEQPKMDFFSAKSVSSGNVDFSQGNNLKNHKAEIGNAMEFSKNMMEDREASGIDEPSMKAISQVANSYIVAESADGLVLIDQHAAHEKVRFEQLMTQFEKQDKNVQALLVPLQMEFSADELTLIQENQEVFDGLGFEIEPFGGNSYVIQAVPNCLSGEDIDSVIKGVLDDLQNEKTPSNMQGRTEEILTYMSCRSAIKFGQSLRPDEMQALIGQMEKLKRPYTCPHGRPTMISLTLDELEKMFGRK